MWEALCSSNNVHTHACTHTQNSVCSCSFRQIWQVTHGTVGNPMYGTFLMVVMGFLLIKNYDGLSIP